MKTHISLASIAAVALLLSQSFLLCSCGGGSVANRISPKQASNQVATATTPDQMHTAFNGVVSTTGIVRLTSTSNGIGAITANTQQGYEEYQLNAPPSAYPTLRQAYQTMNSDPLLAGIRLTLSAEDVAASIDSNLAYAYAHLNSTESATLVLLSSSPGHIPSQPPTITADSTLCPLQLLMLAKYLGLLVATRGNYHLGPTSAYQSCINGCNAAYYATIAAIGALVAACSFGSGFLLSVVCGALGAVDAALASDVRDQCRQNCHHQ